MNEMNLINNVQGLLPELLLSWIAPNIALPDCASMAKVCKQWNRAITQEFLEEKLLDHAVFEKKKWLQVQGVFSVSDDPIMDQTQKTTLINKLKEKCNFFNEPDNIQDHRFQKSTDNRFWQTRLVILFPEEINGEPVDINRIGQLFSFEKADNKGTVFDFICGNVKEEYRNRSLSRTYFAMVSLDVIPGSRKTDLVTKENLLKPKGCRIPTPLEAVISNLVINIGKKEGYFFGREGKYGTFTVTDELFNHKSLVVGGASPGGPEVDYCCYDAGDYCRVGAAAVAEVL